MMEHGHEIVVETQGNGRFDAASNAIQKEFGIKYDNLIYSEHAMEIGATSRAIAYVGITAENGKTYWGAGMDTDIITASIKALISAVNRMGFEIILFIYIKYISIIDLLFMYHM